ncbi:MAG: hypothetical protein CM1200mP13_12080 [Candidatus Pelagibacterales bacterium]|nr:MAG: hypothetical protein CM1200mP13_12080 [Pelagibacterales bacterium]
MFKFFDKKNKKKWKKGNTTGTIKEKGKTFKTIVGLARDFFVKIISLFFFFFICIWAKNVKGDDNDQTKEKKRETKNKQILQKLRVVGKTITFK